MLVANETIYNTADIEKLFDYAVINSTPAGDAPARSVDFLNIVYSSGSGVGGDYIFRNKRLDLALPRKSTFKSVSALENLAAAALESPIDDGPDEDYCFVAPTTIRRGIVLRLLSLLLRRSRASSISADGIPLRYTIRLKRGQKEAQKLGYYRYKTLQSQKQIERLRANILEYQEKERKSLSWFEDRGIEPIC